LDEIVQKKNKEDSVFAGKKNIGLEVNTDETKYMVKSRDQTVGQK
jgi:hypothetical protein